MFLTRKTTAFCVMTLCALAGCASQTAPIDDATPDLEQASQPIAGAAKGAVYAMTNASGANEIVVYQRAADGTLSFLQVVPTGGGGSGIQLDPVDSLGSQGSLVLSADHRHLFAVNTETVSTDHDCHQGSISVFNVGPGGALTLAGPPVPSGGLYPDSVAVHGDTLYVLNSGGPDVCVASPGFEPYPHVAGFRLGASGSLTPIAGSARLVNPGVGPAPDTCAPGGFAGGSPQFDCGLNPPAFPRSPGQVAFTPDGDQVIVSVKGTNALHVFPVAENGTLGAPTVTRAPGAEKPTYFGFGFDGHGHVIVSEPFGRSETIPAGGASAVSSFDIKSGGSLMPRSRSVENGETATCWIAIDPRSQSFAYAANNGTNSISVYAIHPSGALTYLPAATAPLPAHEDELAHPNELATAIDEDDDASFLYSMNSGTGMVSAFRIEQDGSLSPLGEIGGLPVDDGAQGLAAY
ncbi:MAG: beta-propeller fold lactonase family protein [Polyangiaceae bacterium]